MGSACFDGKLVVAEVQLVETVAYSFQTVLHNLFANNKFSEVDKIFEFFYNPLKSSFF